MAKTERLSNLHPWLCAAAVLSVIVVAAVANVNHAATAKGDTHWVEIKPAVTSGTFDTFDLVVPKGYKLCGPPAEFPASNGQVIPVDSSVACRSFDQNHPDQFPDSLAILDWADAAMQYDNVRDLIPGACPKGDWDAAGNTMGGLDTIICTEDLGDGHTLKMALAYYGEPENGFEIRVGVDYHAGNKEKAEALLQKTLAAMKFRPVHKK
jgi:hypothetical protein